MRVWDFTWDGDDRLRGVKEGTTSRLTARYNGAGERVVTTEGWTGTHTYSRTVGAYYDTFNNALTTPGLGQKVNNVDKYFHTDAQGSTRGLSDSTGAIPNALRYDAFGVQTWQSGGDWHPSSALYAGAWGYEAPHSSATEPGLGFLYVEQRYYDPDTGRLLARDPIRSGGGPAPPIVLDIAYRSGLPRPRSLRAKAQARVGLAMTAHRLPRRWEGRATRIPGSQDRGWPATRHQGRHDEPADRSLRRRRAARRGAQSGCGTPGGPGLASGRRDRSSPVLRQETEGRAVE